MMFNSKGGDNIRTPSHFQSKARKEIETHLGIRTAVPGPGPGPNAAPKTSLKYGSSPLRQVSTVDDDCSTIDSGKSGCSLSHDSAIQLMRQQQVSLQRINTNLTDDNSLFDQYTLGTTATSINNNTYLGDRIDISLEQALPKNFADYYSPDLDVERFSNGRPIFTKRPLKNWELNDLRSLLIYPELPPDINFNEGGKIPSVRSPYPNIYFRIQIIPNYISDKQMSKLLAQSDIYKEAKLPFEFRLHTAHYIVERARLRHKQILIDSFGVSENQFNDGLLGDIGWDSYFKFEWRNIIENFMLNLGIEWQCRLEFKERIKKLRGIGGGNGNELYKKVLVGATSIETEEFKGALWKEVQRGVYKRLEVDW